MITGDGGRRGDLDRRRTSAWLAGTVIAVGLLACTGDDPLIVGGGGVDAAVDGGADGPGSSGGPCAPDQKACAASCVPIDPAHGCASLSCTPCSPDKKWASACGPDAKCQCLAGFDNCDKDPDNGCERDVRADTKNCGRCGNTCGETATASPPTCEDGKCKFACAPAYAHCAADDATGCETSTNTDPLNCGACGHSCLGALCFAGRCETILLATSDLLSGVYGLGRVGTTLYGSNINVCATVGTVSSGLVVAAPTTPVKLDGGALPPPVDIVLADATPNSPNNAAQRLAVSPGANPLLSTEVGHAASGPCGCD